MKDFSKFCTPAKIYLTIAVLASIIALFKGVHIMMAFWKLFFAAIWSYILEFLCKKGFASVSWFLVLLPYIIMALAFFNIYRVTHKQKEILRAVKLQGAYGLEHMRVMNPASVNELGNIRSDYEDEEE
jgi:hypothetical protein